jgi:hypothetical protein
MFTKITFAAAIAIAIAATLIAAPELGSQSATYLLAAAW